MTRVGLTHIVQAFVLGYAASDSDPLETPLYVPDTATGIDMKATGNSALPAT